MLVSGCTRDWKFQPNDMWNKSRLKPYEPIGLAEGVEVSASRPLPNGTIARGQLRIDEAMYNGTLNGRLVTTIPAAAMRGVTMRQLAERGKERYDIYCLPCHGIVGNGDGMVTKRGMAVPPSYSLPRLRNAPIGHFYDVITNGYGAMYSYASACSATRPLGDRGLYPCVAAQPERQPGRHSRPAERANVKTPEQILGAREPMSQTPGMPGEMALPNTTKKPFGEPAASPNDKAGQPTD
jgi:hypothetical protein